MSPCFHVTYFVALATRKETPSVLLTPTRGPDNRVVIFWLGSGGGAETDMVTRSLQDPGARALASGEGSLGGPQGGGFLDGEAFFFSLRTLLVLGVRQTPSLYYNLHPQPRLLIQLCTGP